MLGLVRTPPGIGIYLVHNMDWASILVYPPVGIGYFMSSLRYT